MYLPRPSPPQRTRMKKTTACISPDGLVNIANAFAFSEQKGTPFTAFVTVAWTKTAGWTDDLLPERQGQLFWNLARWLRKRGVPAAYVWTLENSKRMGVHLNLAVHVPDVHFGAFTRQFSQLVPGFVEDRYAVQFTADNGDTRPKLFFHPNQRRGTLRYFLKGMDHTATFEGLDGQLVNLGDFIGIQHRGQQGVIEGKRCGVSHALGAQARIAAGYTDRTDPEGLRTILAKAPITSAVEARPEGRALERSAA